MTYVTECELMDRKSIMHYSDRPTKFVKVYTQLPRYISQLRAFVEKGMNFHNQTFWSTTYESNLP